MADQIAELDERCIAPIRFSPRGGPWSGASRQVAGGGVADDMPVGIVACMVAARFFRNLEAA